jgi:hypothetical protein
MPLIPVAVLTKAGRRHRRQPSAFKVGVVDSGALCPDLREAIAGDLDALVQVALHGGTPKHFSV